MNHPRLTAGIGIVTTAAIGGVVVGVWLYHGLTGPMGNQFTALWPRQFLLYGRLAGLAMGLIFLYQLASLAKGHLLDSVFPRAALVRWHRRLGLTAGVLLCIHIPLVLVGYAASVRRPWYIQARDFVLKGNWGMVTAIGAVLLVAILIFCGLQMRRKISYPFWKRTHYWVYPMIVLVFFHQIMLGTDFARSAWFRLFWIVLFGAIAVDLIFFRWVRPWLQRHIELRKLKKPQIRV